MSSLTIDAKMVLFGGFGRCRAAIWAEQPFLSFVIIFYHPKEHSLSSQLENFLKLHFWALHFA